MSTIASETPKRRSRRQFSEEFKQQAVRLVLDERKSMAAIARELDLVPTALSEWVKRADADRTHGRTGLTRPSARSLARLWKENRSTLSRKRCCSWRCSTPSTAPITSTWMSTSAPDGVRGCRAVNGANAAKGRKIAKSTGRLPAALDTVRRRVYRSAVTKLTPYVFDERSSGDVRGECHFECHCTGRVRKRTRTNESRRKNLQTLIR